MTGTKRRLSPRRLPQSTTVIAAAAVLAIFAGLLAVRWHHAPPYSGDEPHYLIIANSLVTDGDVDVKNDYLDRRYLQYTHGPIDAHVNPRIFTPESPHWYSQHGVALPAFLVPGVVLDFTRGATVEMVILALIVVVLAFLWVRRFTQRRWAAVVAVVALCASPFFLGLEGRIFPDLPTAALLLGCLLLLEMPSQGRRHLLLLSLLAAVSPWLHFKNAVAFAAVIAIAVVQAVRHSLGFERICRLGLLVAPVLGSAIGFELAVHSWYHSWLPMQMFPPGNDAFALNPAMGFAAESFDSAQGLFSNNPALLLILAGLPLWLRLRRGSFLRMLVILGPTLLLNATFDGWAGGYAPPGRYALQFAPAFLPAIGVLLEEGSRAIRVLAATMLAVQWALAGLFVWLHPPWGFGVNRSPFLAGIDDKLGIGLDRVMPSFDFQANLARGDWQLVAWLAAACALLAYGLRAAFRTSSNRLLEPSPTT